MDFMHILKSFEEFLFEVVSWLFFFPRTMWRTIRHPAKMMAYADQEIGDSAAHRYADTMSPPLFLLMTLIIAAIVASAVTPAGMRGEQTSLLPAYFRNEEHLLIFRTMIFSAFPLLLSIRLLRQRGVAIDRSSLRPPFYSQCYAAAPFAFASSVGVALASAGFEYAEPAGLALIVLALGWYLWVQAKWFARYLAVGLARASFIAGVAILQGFAILILVVLAIHFVPD
jgi:hypothetical protein